MDTTVRESNVSIPKKENVAEGLLVEEGFGEQVLATIHTVEQAEKVISKYIKQIKKKSSKRLNSLIQKQVNEVEEFQKLRRERKANLEKHYKSESAVIHSLNTSQEVKADQLKILEVNHSQMLDQLQSRMDVLLEDMKTRHQAKIDDEEKEATRLLDEFSSWTKTELFGNLQFNEAFEECGLEMDAANSCSMLESDLKEQNANVSNDSEREISDNNAASNSPRGPSQSNDEIMTFADIANIEIPDGSGVQGIHDSSPVGMDVDLATSMIDELLSAQNPTLQIEADANDEVSRTEPCDEDSSSTHTVHFDGVEEQNSNVPNEVMSEPVNFPSIMNPHVAQPVTNEYQVDGANESQEHATSPARSNQLNDEHVCAETSVIQDRMVLNTMLPLDDCDGLPCNASDQPPAPAVPLTQPSLASFGVPGNQLENNAASRSLPATVSASHFSQGPETEFDPLLKVYERLRGVSTELCNNNKDMVSSLQSRCDKEIEEVGAQVRRKYESKLQEAEASYLKKKNELDNNQRKVLMNMALAETFRYKCNDERTGMPSPLVQQLLQSQSLRSSVFATSAAPQTERSGFPSSMLVTSTPVQAVATTTSQPLNYTSFRSQSPQPQPQPQIYVTGSHGGPHHMAQNSGRSMSLRRACGSATEGFMSGGNHPSAARSGSSLCAMQSDSRPTNGMEIDVICLSDDE